MKATSSRATTRSRAVRGVPKAYQSSAASMVGSRQIRDRSSHLRGMPRVPGVSGTISNAQLQRQARCDARAHGARECGLWHRAAGGLACTHLQRTLSVPLRLQGSSQAGRYYRQDASRAVSKKCSTLRSSTARRRARRQKLPVWPRCAVSWPVQRRRERRTAITSEPSIQAGCDLFVAK